MFSSSMVCLRNKLGNVYSAQKVSHRCLRARSLEGAGHRMCAGAALDRAWAHAVCRWHWRAEAVPGTRAAWARVPGNSACTDAACTGARRCTAPRRACEHSYPAAYCPCWARLEAPASPLARCRRSVTGPSGASIASGQRDAGPAGAARWRRRSSAGITTVPRVPRQIGDRGLGEGSSC